jgi:hypothetical protein
MNADPITNGDDASYGYRCDDKQPRATAKMRGPVTPYSGR